MSVRRVLKGWIIVVAVAGLWLAATGEAHGVGFGVKGGVGLLQKEDPFYGGTTSGKTLWMVGGYLDVGGVVSSRVRITPSFEYSSRSGTRIISISLEGRYQFYQGPKAVVYAGMGPGVNVKRITTDGLRAGVSRKVKGSLNIPIGVERKLGKGGVRWTFEMKMAIADDQVDSAYRIGTGFAFSLR